MENFVNPFDAGVSYADFKESIPKGTTIREHCKGKLSKEEIDWIEVEIEHFDASNKVKQKTKK